MNKTRLLSIDKKHIWHPFTQMAEWVREDQLIIERGEGNYLIDISGNRYFDGVSSLWVNLFGHRRTEIDEAVKSQLGRIAHSTFLGLSHPPAIELAEKLVTIAPSGLTRVFYSDNGSTAMEIAIKMAFQFWKQGEEGGNGRRTKFLTLTEAYHGDTIGSVSAGGIGLFHAVFSPLLFETIRMPAPFCYRCPYGMERADCGMYCAEKISERLAAGREEIGALIMEPVVQGAGGMIVHPDGFLRRMREATEETGALMIVDEVATGFGRTGTMFAVEQEGVRPDIMALAKGMTGGYLPLAATMTTEKVYDAFLGRYEDFKTFFHGHSYTANPAGCAAALATLDIFASGDVLPQVSRTSARLTERLGEISSWEHVGDVRQRGLMAGIELVQDREAKSSFDPALRVGQRVVAEARKRGVIIRPLGDVIVLMPPLSTTRGEIDLLCDAVIASIRHVLEGL